MLDIKDILKNTQSYIDNLNKRNKDYQNEITKMILIYQEYLKELKIVEDCQAIINENSKLIGTYKRENKNIDELLNSINNAKEKISQTKVSSLKKEYEQILMLLPNIIDDDTIIGKNEDDNKVIKVWGEKPTFDFNICDHAKIGEIVDGIDLKRAAKLSKARFVITKGEIAKLERAITNYMLDIHEAHGYIEFGIPVIVSGQTLRGSGQLPKFEEDLFKIASTENKDDEFNAEQRDFYLVPTAEVVLANYHSGEMLNYQELPLKYSAYSQSFRKEAGSAGRDTRGIIRVHQFGKVEMFNYVLPKDAPNALKQMIKQAEEILQGLKLPYRIVELCSGDIGFAATKTYDLEVWFPEQNKYRECSSCSNVLDFQARRASIRYKDEHGQSKYPYMLNGSGMATGRILAAVMENYQLEDGTIEIPEVLKKYMNR